MFPGALGTCAHLLPWATSCSPKTAGYQPYQLEAGAGDPVAGRDPLPAPSPTCTYNGVPWSFTSWARLRGRRGQRPPRQRRACCPRLRQPAVDGPPLEEAVVPPNQVPSSISPTVPFVALQIEDQAAHPAAHPEPAQSWSLTWDQFDQLLGSGSQATPPDFGRLDFDSGVPISVGNLDIDRSFDALPTREPIQGFPRGGENDPIEDFSPSQVAGSAQPEAGERAIEDWPQVAGLPPVSGSSDVDIVHDHLSPADMDFIPDAVSSHLSGTRDRDADRYNAGPNPPLSSGTQDRDANRCNAGSNPLNQASGNSSIGRGPRNSRPESFLHFVEKPCQSLRGLQSASDSERVRARHHRPRRAVQPPYQRWIRAGCTWYWVYSLRPSRHSLPSATQERK